tara:strand:- start:2557 stop:3219 length:663 start_codon:yes stop_codon:yes gene_type:complete
MTLLVHYLCSYYSRSADREVAKRSEALWDAYNFCRAVKYGETKSFFTIPLKSGGVEINENNVIRARRIFGNYVKSVLKDFGGGEFPTVTPVPSKDSATVSLYRSLKMLHQSLPDSIGRIDGILRFTVPRQRAAEGGARGYSAVYPYIEVVGDKLPDRVVLVDDVVTTGGSLLAAKDRLNERGVEVPFAIVCGRTTHEIEPAFKKRSFELQEQDDMSGLWG